MNKAPVNYHFYYWRLNSFDFVFKIKSSWSFTYFPVTLKREFSRRSYRYFGEVSLNIV